MAWWHKAVVYQIYPRSFQDSNGDGIGDLPGIIARLDYLHQLGVDALWLSPVYRSPGVDNGYDIADYQAIDPQYGTMADMHELIAAAAKRNMRIIMDLVVNHTSDQHPWFQQSRLSRASPKRDWYIWRDQPNAMTSTFGGSAWTKDPLSGQYYLHLFAPQQPDLNWANPDLRQAVYQMMNFWLDQGIGGFRLDVIDLIGKMPDQLIRENGPHLHEYLKEMHDATFGRGDYLTVGETWGATPEIAQLYSDPARHELSMVFQFETATIDQLPGQSKWQVQPFDPGKLKQALIKWQTQLDYTHGWNSLFWNNHDLPRIVSRWGDESPQAAMMFAICLHLLRGTPYVYQGEELGMTNRVVSDIAQVKDLESRNFYAAGIASGQTPQQLLAAINAMGRDTARTPMQWDTSKQAGFTTGTPWLAVNPNYQTINAASANPVLALYRQLIRLRHEQPLVVAGDFVAVTAAPAVMAYERRYQGQRWLVVANLTNQRQPFSHPGTIMHKVVDNMPPPQTLQGVTLQPYQAFVVSIA